MYFETNIPKGDIEGYDLPIKTQTVNIRSIRKDYNAIVKTNTVIVSDYNTYSK